MENGDMKDIDLDFQKDQNWDLAFCVFQQKSRLHLNFSLVFGKCPKLTPSWLLTLILKRSGKAVPHSYIMTVGLHWFVINYSILLCLPVVWKWSITKLRGWNCVFVFISFKPDEWHHVTFTFANNSFMSCALTPSCQGHFHPYTVPYSLTSYQCSANVTPRMLSSSSERRLALPPVQVRQSRLFSFVVPRWWNELPSTTRAGASLSTF